MNSYKVKSSKRQGALFTNLEKKEILRLLKLDYTYRQIAKEVKRSPSGVFNEVQRNGGRKNYNPPYFKEYENEIDFGNSKNFEKRIENLEMQVAILHDFIKENFKS